MSACRVCHRTTFDDDLCPDCNPPQSGPLRFYRQGDAWEVWDSAFREANHLLGHVYMRGTWPWFEPGKDRTPMSRREVEALATFMRSKEQEAK